MIWSEEHLEWADKRCLRAGGARRLCARKVVCVVVSVGEIFEHSTDDRRESEARPPKGAGSRRGLGQSPQFFFDFLQLQLDIPQTRALSLYLLPASFVSTWVCNSRKASRIIIHFSYVRL
jgi:hypothetical protein